MPKIKAYPKAAESQDEDPFTLPETRVRHQLGFTLVEMLVVVVILGVLATLAVVAYGGWIGRARRSEAVAMLAEISAKEQIYLSEFAAYLPLRAGEDIPVMPSVNEDVAAFYPVSPAAPGFESRRTSTPLDLVSRPAGWRSIGVRPRRSEAYCTYLANAGHAGQAVPGPVGAPILMPVDPPITSWFYAVAACNITGPSGYPNDVTVMVVTSESPTIRLLNDGH